MMSSPRYSHPSRYWNLDGECRRWKAAERLAGVIPIRSPRPVIDTRHLEINILSAFQEDDPDNDEDGGAVICQPDRLPHNQRPGRRGDNRRDVGNGRGGYRAIQAILIRALLTAEAYTPSIPNGLTSRPHPSQCLILEDMDG